MKTLAKWLKRGEKAKKKRKPMPKVSKRRVCANREYAKRRKLFLEAHPYDQALIKTYGQNEADVIASEGCAAMCIVSITSRHQPCFAPLTPWQTIPRSTEIHHVKGRGKHLNDESSWLAVSRPTHNFIHANPSKARLMGLLA